MTFIENKLDMGTMAPSLSIAIVSECVSERWSDIDEISFDSTELKVVHVLVLAKRNKKAARVERQSFTQPSAKLPM